MLNKSRAQKITLLIVNNETALLVKNAKRTKTDDELRWLLFDRVVELARHGDALLDDGWQMLLVAAVFGELVGGHVDTCAKVCLCCGVGERVEDQALDVDAPTLRAEGPMLLDHLACVRFECLRLTLVIVYRLSVLHRKNL